MYMHSQNLAVCCFYTLKPRDLRDLESPRALGCSVPSGSEGAIPLFFGYLKLRVLLANEPFSLAWFFAELEPPVVNVSAAAYVYLW